MPIVPDPPLLQLLPLVLSTVVHLPPSPPVPASSSVTPALCMSYMHEPPLRLPPFLAWQFHLHHPLSTISTLPPLLLWAVPYFSSCPSCLLPKKTSSAFFVSAASCVCRCPLCWIKVLELKPETDQKCWSHKSAGGKKLSIRIEEVVEMTLSLL